MSLQDNAVTPAADTARRDAAMMRRCIDLSAAMPRFADVPIACVISIGDRVVAQATNEAHKAGDVTRHAELIALSLAQKVLNRRDLSDCVLYTTVEPCPMCSFPIRECRIGRVVYALNSPVMGGLSKWNILRDNGISDAIPQVFGPVPEVVAGLMWRDAARVWRRWNPIVWAFIWHRGFFGPPPETDSGQCLPGERPRGWLRSVLRRGR